MTNSMLKYLLNNMGVSYSMRKAISLLLLVSLFITTGYSEMNSPGTSSAAKDSANCFCRLPQLKCSEPYITELKCKPGDCPGFEGIYTYEEGGTEYAWDLPGYLESQSPLRLYLFDVENRSPIAAYTVGLKNVGTIDLKTVILTVTLPSNLAISSSSLSFLQSGSNVTWYPFVLRSTEAKDIEFSTNWINGSKANTNLTAVAVGVGDDDRKYVSEWNAGVYEKSAVQMELSPEGFKKPIIS
jgi:uncharacterized repeat protein (TIGR01451 family)